MDKLKLYFMDFFRCIKISIIAFLIPFVIGFLISLFLTKFKVALSINWGATIVQYVAILGLLTCGIAFTKESLLRPLNYQDQWKQYFKKFSLVAVILIVSILILIFSYTIQGFL